MIGFLAAPFKNNIPLIEGEGHFGSRISPSAIGAPRYTDVKRAKAAEAILYRDLDIIPLEDNYDGSNKQPKHFLPLIPLVLLNGVSGIAVGWSTNILPRDLKSLIEATKLALVGKPIAVIPPSYNHYNISITSIGPNRWEFGGRAKTIDINTVQITELPPGMDIESFRKRLIKMETNDANFKFHKIGQRNPLTSPLNLSVIQKHTLKQSMARWSIVLPINRLRMKKLLNCSNFVNELPKESWS